MKKEQFPILGMHCVSCALTIEGALKKVPGVKNASVNFATEKATVEYEGGASEEQLQKAVRATGYKLIIEADGASAENIHAHHKTMKMESHDGGEHDHHRMLKEAEIKLLRKKLVVGSILSVFVIFLSFPDYFSFIGGFLSN